MSVTPHFTLDKLIQQLSDLARERLPATQVERAGSFFKAYYHYARLLDKKGKKQEAIGYMKSIVGSSKDLPDYKLEKERFWIDEASKFLRKNGVELA